MKNDKKKIFSKEDLFKLKSAIIYLYIIGLFGSFYYSKDIYEKKNYLKTKTVMNKDEVLSVDEKYDDFEEDKSYITIYGEWQKRDYDTYKRNIKKYEVKDLSLNDINRLLNKNINEIENILGKPTSIVNETKSLVSEEEYKKGIYIEATIIEESKIEYKCVLRPIHDVVTNTTVFILFAITVGCVWENCTGIAINKLKECDFNYNETAKLVLKNIVEKLDK